MPQRNIDHSVPPHLKKYVVEQNYAKYTPEDQAVWRFIMRQLRHFLADNAHPIYVEGLAKTGISIEEIPRIEVMNRRLEEFGWGAVAVSGFIPPAAFMEFQARGYLPIACDMRTMDHILYTPAPDIVHEAAGHAPIIVDPSYADYLKKYAEVAANAIISHQDLEQYRLIRMLSDLKEDPSSPPEVIKSTERELQRVSESIIEISEAGWLSRMNWWTAEYGLIGETEKPRIFGAGLLSSVGEARECLKPKVKKIPLSVDCINTGYDITEPQPQLYVAKDFAHLTEALITLSEQMAFKRGGLLGLRRAQKAKTVNTVEFANGLQISGVLQDIRLSPDDKPYYLKFSGPCQLSHMNIELPGHGRRYHLHGYSTPLGGLRELNGKSLVDATENEINRLALAPGRKIELNYVSGVIVTGTIKSLTHMDKKLILITLESATVTDQGELLYSPDWGPFDLAIGDSIPSVFGGSADRKAYGEVEADFPAARVPEKIYDAQKKKAHQLFKQIRELRDKLRSNQNIEPELHRLTQLYKTEFKQNWLIGIELLELGHTINATECIKSVDACLKNAAFSESERICIRLGQELSQTSFC